MALALDVLSCDLDLVFALTLPLCFLVLAASISGMMRDTTRHTTNNRHRLLFILLVLLLFSTWCDTAMLVVYILKP